MTFAAIVVAAVAPWLAAIVWFVAQHGRSLLDGRATPSQASQLRSFGARR